MPDEIRTPHPRFGRDRWPERLAGRVVRSVDATGKHLFIGFEGGLTIHSHLRMTGSWGVYDRGARWHRHPRRAWLVITGGEREVVQFDGPVLELMTDARARADQRIATLGPDIIGAAIDEPRIIRRLREDDPTRQIGDALLDQRTVAGIGNLWKSEGCWDARVDPWRAARSVTDEQVLEILRAVRPRMQESALHGAKTRRVQVYDRAGRPCPRCGTTILARGQGDSNRLTFWCPGCQL